MTTDIKFIDSLLADNAKMCALLAEALAVIENEAKAIKLLSSIRCSAERHVLPRQWLTDADVVIAYWGDVRSGPRRQALVDTLDALLRPDPLFGGEGI